MDKAWLTPRESGFPRDPLGPNRPSRGEYQKYLFGEHWEPRANMPDRPGAATSEFVSIQNFFLMGKFFFRPLIPRLNVGPHGVFILLFFPAPPL